MSKINWNEYLETYNRIKKASFKTPQEMVAHLYKQEGTLLKTGDVLGVSDNSVSLFMQKHGLPRNPKGHSGNSKYQIAFREIKNPRNYMHRELADMIGCSMGYIPSLLKKHSEKDFGTANG